MANQFLIKNTMADMRDLSASEIASLQGTNPISAGVELLGYYEKGDTPAPIRYYINATTGDNGGSEIPGLKHVFNEAIDPRYFGAQSGVDTTLAYQKLIEYSLLHNLEINNNGKTYIVNGISISGDNTGTIRITGGKIVNTTKSAFEFSNLNVVDISSVIFEPANTIYNSMSLKIKNCNNVLVKYNQFLKTELGVKVFNCSNVNISENTVTESTQQGIYLEGCRRSFINKNIALNNAFDGIKMGGVMPPNAIVGHYDVIVSENVSCYNGRDGFDIASNEIDGIKISGNIFRNNKLLGIDCKLVYQGGYAANVDISQNLCIDNLEQGINFQREHDVTGVTKFIGDIKNNIVTSELEIRNIAIRVSGITMGSVMGNICRGYNHSLRIIGSSGLRVYDNNFDSFVTGVMVTCIHAAESCKALSIENNFFKGSKYAVQFGLNADDAGTILNPEVSGNKYSTSADFPPVNNLKATNPRIFNNVRGSTSFITESSLSSITSNKGDIFLSQNPTESKFFGFIYNGVVWEKYLPLIKQSLAIANPTALIPLSAETSSATTVQEAVISLNDLTNKYNQLRTAMIELRQSHIGKLNTDRNSGQQAI